MMINFKSKIFQSQEKSFSEMFRIKIKGLNFPIKHSVFGLILLSYFSYISCSPKISIPKQNLSIIKDEVKNSEGDDIAPAQQKIMECVKATIEDSLKINHTVMASSKYIDSLFSDDLDSGNKLRRETIRNMTKNVESVFFTDIKSGFASFAHPPAPEFLMGENLPFEKEYHAGGTDIFYFSTASSTDSSIKFRSFSKINSPYWDSHPTAVTQQDKSGKCVTLLIFSSDRNSPFSKAINQKGDTIYGGSTDLFYLFGKIDINNSDGGMFDYVWTDIRKLEGANTSDFNEGSPFVYCQCCNPTLFFSSNRNNQNRADFDIYAVKLNIDFENMILTTNGNPELVDKKSMTTDSATNSINTIADERFPFIPFPHKEKGSDNFLYFSSDRNKKPENKPCDCERGNDRVENIGGYDIYKYILDDKFACPQEKEPAPPPEIVYSPELYADIVIIDALNPTRKVKDSEIKLFAGKEEIAKSDTNRLFVKLDFDTQYKVIGGSSFNNLDCESNREIIFRGYSAPDDLVISGKRDSSKKIELLTGYSMKAKDFINMNKDSVKFQKGVIFEKGYELESDDKIEMKPLNARIEGDMVYYDNQFVYTKYWNRINVRPDFNSAQNQSNITKAINSEISSVLTLNDGLQISKPNANERIILKDTIYVLPDEIIKPPCYCEFAGVLTNYQQNVPYFQTGFWEVNTLKNYRRDIPRLETGKFSDAKWIELHSDNQYFGEGKNGRLSRFNEYENYAKTVDSNLSKMADMIINSIIPVFKVIDSITPGGKLIISLDAWSDKRPVRRGWYIGDEVSYTEGVLNETPRGYDINFQKVVIPDKSSLNLNNDTLSRLRAYTGYKELLNKLLDTNKFGKGFYEYFKNDLVLLPDDPKLSSSNLNLPFSLKSVEELIYNSKIIILAKGNYFDPTEYKIPKYIKDVDSSLFMLDTIRRIDVRINTLQYQAGKLIKSPCCNDLLPCVDFRKKLDMQIRQPSIINEKRKSQQKRRK